MTVPHDPTVLDGSTGHELRSRLEFDERLWSATALLEAPEVVRDLHGDYIRAGADVITTNTYGLVPARLREVGIEDRLDELAGLACRLADRARGEGGREVMIAGSLPPLRGSYRPDRVGDHDEILPIYERLAGLLADHVDVLLCETMSTAAEAHAAAAAATTTGTPTWVAWTLDDASDPVTLRSGESLADAVDALSDLEPEALLVNCCSPESITRAVPRLAAMTDLPVGGHPNTFADIPDDVVPDTTDRIVERDDLSPDAFADAATGWLEAGATVVGGCCGIGPDHIAELTGRGGR